MKKNHFLLAVVAILLITAIALRIKEAIQNKPETKIIEQEKKELEIKDDINFDHTKSKELAIKIIEPLEDELITSPYKIKGMIPANYLLKTNYYVLLIDNISDAIIDVSQIEVQEKWDTYEAVPFSAILEFPESSGQGIISIREMKNNALVSIDKVEDVSIIYLSE